MKAENISGSFLVTQLARTVLMLFSYVSHGCVLFCSEASLKNYVLVFLMAREHLKCTNFITGFNIWSFSSRDFLGCVRRVDFLVGTYSLHLQSQACGF
jgi:hypothetical protein